MLFPHSKFWFFPQISGIKFDVFAKNAILKARINNGKTFFLKDSNFIFQVPN